LTCAICEKRKEKRFCPAVHGRICPQCCGEQREITLDCPAECVYLQQAHAHEKPRSVAALDPATMFPNVQIGDRFLYEQEHLLLGVSYALAKSARADRGVRDADLIGALTSLAKSYQTLASSGLHYETPMTSLTQQAIAAEVQQMLKEYREAEQEHLGYTRLREADVLRALVFLVRMGMARTSGRPKSKGFVEFLFRQFPEPAASVAAPTQSSIILP
jgi:hypothetical protein